MNRLDWTAGLALDVFGVPIGLRANHPALLPRVGNYLPTGWRLAAEPEVEVMVSLLSPGLPSRERCYRPITLFFNHEQLARSTFPDRLYSLLSTQLLGYVAIEAPGHIFLSAGVVAWQGQAILLPAYETAERASLVQAFLSRGATYISRTFAVLDADGRVYPYLEPARQARSVGEPRSWQPTAIQMQVHAPHEPLPVGQVLITQPRRRARWHPRPLTTGQGLLALTALAPAARDYPGRVLATLHQLAAHTRLWQGAYSDPAQVAEQALSGA